MKKNIILSLCAVLILLFMLVQPSFAADSMKRAAVYGSMAENDGGIRSVADVRVFGNNIYLLDRDNHKVSIFLKNGSFVKSFGSFGCNEGQFNSATKITVDPEGDLFVLDYYNADYDKDRAAAFKENGQYMHPRIQKFDKDGRFIFSMGRTGNKEGEFMCVPSDIAADKKGRLVVLDSCSSRILIFESSGKFLKQFGSYGKCETCFINPSHVEIDADNNILIFDPGNSRFMKFDEEGNTLPMAAVMGNEEGQLLNQEYFKALSDGRIAVLQSFNMQTGDVSRGDQDKYYIISQIKYFDKNGKFMKYCERVSKEVYDAPPYNFKLIQRNFVCIGSDDELYLTDTRNLKLERYTFTEVAVDFNRLTKQAYIDGRVSGGYDKYFPVPSDPGFTRFDNSGIKAEAGVNMNYRLDERTNISFNGAGYYGKYGNSKMSYLLAVPSGEIYDAEVLGGRAEMNYGRVYDMNENKRINVNVGFSYDSDLKWFDPDSYVWHYTANAIHSILNGGFDVDITPSFNLRCTTQYYFWADHYNDSDYAHPNWTTSGRLTLGF